MGNVILVPLVFDRLPFVRGNINIWCRLKEDHTRGNKYSAKSGYKFLIHVKGWPQLHTLEDNQPDTQVLCVFANVSSQSNKYINLNNH